MGAAVQTDYHTQALKKWVLLKRPEPMSVQDCALWQENYAILFGTEVTVIYSGADPQEQKVEFEFFFDDTVSSHDFNRRLELMEKQGWQISIQPGRHYPIPEA